MPQIFAQSNSHWGHTIKCKCSVLQNLLGLLSSHFFFSCEVRKMESFIFAVIIGQGCNKTSKHRLERGSILKQCVAFQIVK